MYSCFFLLISIFANLREINSTKFAISNHKEEKPQDRCLLVPSKPVWVSSERDEQLWRNVFKISVDSDEGVVNNGCLFWSTTAPSCLKLVDTALTDPEFSNMYQRMLHIKYVNYEGLDMDEKVFLTWRMRLTSKPEQAYNKLPGFSDSASHSQHSFRFYVPTGKINYLKESDESKNMHQLGIYVAQKCTLKHDQPRAPCTGIKAGSPSPTLEQNVKLYTPQGKKLDIEDFNPKLMMQQGQMKLVISFTQKIKSSSTEKIVPGISFDPNEGLHMVDTNRPKYNIVLYEDSGNAKLFRPVIATAQIDVPTHIVENNPTPGDEQIYQVININDAWTGPLKLLREATTGTDSNCNVQPSFLGDMFPNWGRDKADNLAVALALCSPNWGMNTSINRWQKTGFACTDYVEQKVSWNDVLDQ